MNLQDNVNPIVAYGALFLVTAVAVYAILSVR